MKKLVLTAVISALSLNAAYAYQVELNGNATYENVDTSNGSTDFFGLGTGNSGIQGKDKPGIQGIYYFKNVTGNNAPLAEGAFTDRASNVNASYSYAKDDDLKLRLNNFNVGGEFYIPNSDFYASANIGRTYAKVKGFKQVGETDYAAEVGLLPITNLLVAVGVAGFDNQSDSETDPTIRAKYLTKIGSNDVNFEGRARFGNHDDNYDVSADYYLDRTLSIGASYDLTTADHVDNTYSIGLNARKFIQSNISIQGGLNAGQYVGNNDFGVNVGGTYRF